MVVKILHTSDLHIGRRLYEQELAEDQQLFFDWMTAFIDREKIGVLLVAGDIFDVANPSGDSRRMYYEMLVRLARLKCRVIISGGNHDSPAMLEAPMELLRELDIHVTGSWAGDPAEMLIPVTGDDGKPLLIIAPVPFLRDPDLRKHVENETWDDRIEAIRSGIIRIYMEIAGLCERQFPGIPAIAMGHFYVHGATLSESEREIQIGNLAGIPSDRLPRVFSYYALGHLHKPQTHGIDGRILYSGAPVQLSFSERNNENRVVVYTLENGSLTAGSVPVPVNRKLIRLSGSVSELKKSLDEPVTEQYPLTTFIELEAVEEKNDPAKVTELETLAGEYQEINSRIIKHRIHFQSTGTGTADLYDAGINIEELKPADVFARKIENDNIEERTAGMLMEAFSELLEEVLQNQKE